MFLAFVLARFHRSRFVWSPALDLTDRTVYATLLPGAQY
jgi:hypothetical protein